MRDILHANRSQSIVGLKSWGIYPDWGNVGKILVSLVEA